MRFVQLAGTYINPEHVVSIERRGAVDSGMTTVTMLGGGEYRYEVVVFEFVDKVVAMLVGGN